MIIFPELADVYPLVPYLGAHGSAPRAAVISSGTPRRVQDTKPWDRDANFCRW
jgi:hypothetical protein